MNNEDFLISQSLDAFRAKCFCGFEPAQNGKVFIVAVKRMGAQRSHLDNTRARRVEAREKKSKRCHVEAVSVLISNRWDWCTGKEKGMLKVRMGVVSQNLPK